MTAQENSTHFGYRDVPLIEKQRMVDDVFHSVAGRYDLMNDLMSVGMHRAWKDALISKLRPPLTAQAFHVLDVAGGTGDIAFRIVAAGGSGIEVTVADINGDMLTVGRERAETRGIDHVVHFAEVNAESLSFPDKHFDAVTIAFGIRNVPRIPVALRKMFRVLKTGGQFFCLEFSNVDLPGLDAIYDAYSFRAIPEIGRLVTGDREAYQYLVESIRKFPDRDAFSKLMVEAGFSRVQATPMSGGIVALHSGWKL
ncbi:MAG: bifunctional demethylmenaquinone methyltransferase/2-methoxy-6-polyprenyl-1,4-benzoquinol methylase UbiE [Rhizobiales bacterium]|nr:bifunctional demethylmenaquinone methyltransferase/2-methoxy-6-polyprenyl-1,4-benzoquinol methylase UbiE [Hyphomicrobiales bacterium]